jgi:hypothetical protein
MFSDILEKTAFSIFRVQKVKQAVSMLGSTNYLPN